MVSRHIPLKISRAVKKTFAFRSGTRCGFPQCRKPAVEMHHTKRFSLTKSHEEKEIVPLCKIHHELAHAGLIENEESKPSLWKIGDGRKVSQPVREVDKMVNIKKFNTGKWKFFNKS